MPHSQRLSGIFLDLNGAVLSGLKVDLSTHKTVFKSLRTNSDGAYDFGEIPSGKYKVRVRYGDSEPFCAPKIECSGQGCRIDSYISINPKNKYKILVN